MNSQPGMPWPGGWRGFTMGDTCKEMDAIKVERWGRKGFAARRQVGVGVGWGWGGARELPQPQDLRPKP